MQESVTRTTLNIDDDLLAAARDAARTRAMPVGAVLSEWVRKGMPRALDHQPSKRLPVFKVRKNARTITIEDCKRAEESL